MLTFKKDAGYIHADLIEETDMFSIETITVEGDWYRVGDITEDEEGGYRIGIEEIQRPQPIKDVRSFFLIGDSQEINRN
jgi:hypothetical protein